MRDQSMRVAVSLALLTVPAASLAQGAAAPAAAPAAAGLSVESPIEAIVANPQGKAVLEKEMASLLAHPMFDSFKAMSLKQLQPYSSGAITDEKLAAVDAALKAIK